MSSSLTQLTICSSKNSKFSHMQHLLPRWKGLLQADVGNSMDLKETSIAVLNEQLFNHITNNTKLLSFQSLVLRHNSYCIHLDKWVTCFLGTRKRFLLSLLPKANLKKQKHYSPRNSIRHYRDIFITFNSKKQKREHNRVQQRAFSNTL